MVERYTKFDHDRTEINVRHKQITYATVYDAFVTDDPERDSRCIEKLLDFEQYMVIEKYHRDDADWFYEFFGLFDERYLRLYTS